MYKNEYSYEYEATCLNCGHCQKVVEAKGRAVRRDWLGTFNGVTKTMVEWSENSKVSYGAIKYRLLKGWSVKDALTIPMKKVAL